MIDWIDMQTKQPEPCLDVLFVDTQGHVRIGMYMTGGLNAGYFLPVDGNAMYKGDYWAPLPASPIPTINCRICGQPDDCGCIEMLSIQNWTTPTESLRG